MRLGRQVLDFRCDHCEALARVACAGGLDSRVQRKQVCLFCNVVDQNDNLTNLPDCFDRLSTTLRDCSA